MQNFEINSGQIDKIKKLTLEEKKFRIKNLEFFKSSGFPNKRLEDWKFSDFNDIVYNNFENLEVKNILTNLNILFLLMEIYTQVILTMKRKIK